MENKDKFGEKFIAGRIVNLDTAEISDLESYLSEIENQKNNAKKSLDKLAMEIKSL